MNTPLDSLTADTSLVGLEESLMWVGAGAIESWQDKRYWYDCTRRPGQEHVVIQLTLEGAAFYEDAQGRKLVPRGYAFVGYIPGAFQYGYAPEVGGVYKLAYLSLVGRQAYDWSLQITRRFGHVFEMGLDSPAARQVLNIAKHPHLRGSGMDRFLQSAMAYQLFMTLLSQLSQSWLERMPHITQAMTIIQQQAMDSNFNVNSLSKQMGLSREYLARMFQRVMGVSPLEVILQQRLDLACVMLRQPSSKLDTIAQTCGFTTANYFCRVFRKRYGLSPGQYRQQPGIVLPKRG